MNRPIASFIELAERICAISIESPKKNIYYIFFDPEFYMTAPPMKSTFFSGIPAQCKLNLEYKYFPAEIPEEADQKSTLIAMANKTLQIKWHT